MMSRERKADLWPLLFQVVVLQWFALVVYSSNKVVNHILLNAPFTAEERTYVMEILWPRIRRRLFRIFISGRTACYCLLYTYAGALPYHR